MIVHVHLLILTFTFGLGWTAHFKDDDDVTVSVPGHVIQAHTGEDVDLECFVSETNFVYYIRNRVCWTFKGDAGTTKSVKITDGFFPAYEKHMEFEEGKYRFYYAPSTDSKGYIFRLSNNGVGPEDEGSYTCSLIGQRGKVLSQSSVRVIVNK